MAPLLNYMSKNAVPIAIPRGTNKVEIKKSLSYGAKS